MGQLKFIGVASKNAGRDISLARDRGFKHMTSHLTYTTREANYPAAQLSQDGQSNMANIPFKPNPFTILFHVSGTLEDSRPPSSSSHRTPYSISRFLDPCSEVPWTPEARKEAHNKPRLTESVILSSNLLAIIGSPDQEPPHAADIFIALDSPSDSYAPGRIRASRVESDALIRFLDPRSEAPWTLEDLGRRERALENFGVKTELLCNDEEL
ncbi:hypothetical protein EV426DRAFT_350481 [Tirmania nivea]|nr:hypothetical protein EV426DRAFT_350481 [Tirmania nivea]